MDIKEKSTKSVLNVLIVDDDADLGAFMRMKLAMEAPHFSIALVESGQDCLEYLKTNQVDCILSDYQMPEMNGMELLLGLREAGSDVPVIFVTGQGNEEVAREAFTNGAYDYFTKDFGFAHFARIINSVEQAVAQRASEAGRRHAAEALKQYQQRLQLHVRQTPLAVIDWDTDFRVVSWNPAAEKVFGYTVAEAVGRHAEFIVADSAKPHVDRIWGDLLTRSGGERSTNENVTKDGRTILCEWYNTPLIADGGKVIGVASLVQDISNRKKADEALRASQKYLQAIIDTEPECVKLLSRDGKLMMMNRAGLDMIQADSLEQVKGKPVYGMIVPEHRESFRALGEKVFNGGTGTLEFDMVGFKGMRLRMETHAVPLRNEKDEIVALLGITRDITDRRKAEYALKEKERVLTALIDANPESVLLMDADGVHLAANAAVASRIGKSREEIIGSSVFDLLPTGLAASRKAHLDEVFRTSQAMRFEDTRDGRVIESYINPVIEADGHVSAVAVVGMDITERKRAEDDLRESEIRLKAILDNIPDLVWLKDKESRFIAVNDSFGKACGVAPSTLAGKTDLDIWPKGLAEMYRADDMKVIETGRRRSVEEPLAGIDGDNKWIESIKSPIRDGNGEVVGTVGTARDITWRKNLERQRVDFYAMVTHDFKSPLASILGYSEMISKAAQGISGGNAIDEMAKAVSRGGEKLLRLADDFMAAARLESGGIEVMPVPVEAAVLLYAAREDFEPVAKKKGIAFRADIPDGLPKAVLDKKQVERAIGNLLQNAFNYTPRGGEVTLAAEVLSNGDDKDIVVSVTDTGCGISREDMGKIFDKYYRSQKTARTKGTGLGLAIVKAVAQAHGGRVEVESEEGKGSTFRLYLPLCF